MNFTRADDMSEGRAPTEARPSVRGITSARVKTVSRRDLQPGSSTVFRKMQSGARPAGKPPRLGGRFPEPSIYGRDEPQLERSVRLAPPPGPN